MKPGVALRQRLMGIMLLTSGTVLLLTCAGFFAYDILTFRQSTVRQLSTEAAIIANNSTAVLAFDDRDGAREILSAFRAETHVPEAALYDAQGRLFSRYPESAPPARFPSSLGPDGFHYERPFLVGFQPVVEGEKRLGTLYVKSDLKAETARFRLYGMVAMVVAALSFLIAYLISSRLQRQISGPIMALMETSRAVSERRDYSVRAAQDSSITELGLLTGAFNHMLGHIQGQLARLELLNRITRAIGERLDLPSIFQVVAGTLEDNMPIDFACVLQYESGSATLTVLSVGGSSGPAAERMGMPQGAVIPIDENGLSRCVRGQLVYEADTASLDFPFPKRMAAEGLRSLVISPLLVESEVFGILVAARRKPGAFSSMDCEFLRQLSEHAGLASHQANLYGALQKAYDDLRQSQQTVMQQERLRALGQMASGIAHDINNAISPVALYTESLLNREPNLSPKARDYLQTISHAIEDVAATVARMREFYRREAPVSLSPVQLNRALQQVIDLTRARWNDMPQQRGVVIRIQTDLDPKLPEVMGVEGEVREALTNLFFNAFDAMPEGGTLTLRTRRTDGKVRVEVADTGVGMDEETRRRCMEPFYTTKGERGTGLGLAMVYGVVQRHGAELEILSSQGKGTTVAISFPAKTSTAPGESFSTASGAEPLPRLRILVVDDDPLVLKAVNDILSGEGHVITTANGGQKGVDAFRAALAAQPFDVVITDLGMPYMDGRKVAAAVKEAAPATPVILLTGWGQRLMVEGDLPPQVDKMISKPPKMNELREALAQVVLPRVH